MRFTWESWMSSLGTVLNGFIAAAVCAFCVTGLFKRTKERRIGRSEQSR